MDKRKLYKVRHSFTLIINETIKPVSGDMVLMALDAAEANKLVKDYLTSARTRNVRIISVEDAS